MYSLLHTDLFNKITSNVLFRQKDATSHLKRQAYLKLQPFIIIKDHLRQRAARRRGLIIETYKSLRQFT
jgi:hypothetical protein